VWHNYGFDRHVLQRCALGIDWSQHPDIKEPKRLQLAGFAGDTLHMARLNDAGRKGFKTYSLESLSGDPDVMGRDNLAVLERSKVSLKTMFSVPKLTKGGKPSKSVRELPKIHDIQVCCRLNLFNANLLSVSPWDEYRMTCKHKHFSQRCVLPL
jgi:DNA polymerase-1